MGTFHCTAGLLHSSVGDKINDKGCLPKSDTCPWITESCCACVVVHKVRYAFVCVSHFPATGEWCVRTNDSTVKYSQQKHHLFELYLNLIGSSAHNITKYNIEFRYLPVSSRAIISQAKSDVLST